MAENTLKEIWSDNFTIRLTQQDKDFVDEHIDELFDGDRFIRARKAWMLLCEKALLNVKKSNESKPEDLMHIEELEDALGQHQTSISELTEQLTKSNQAKIELENKYAEALQQIEALQQNPQVQVQEKVIEKVIEIDPTTERLIKMTPLQSFLLAQIEHYHKTDASDILINRFFSRYIQGFSDFDIKIISASRLREIIDHFNKAQSEQKQTQQQ
jgi:tetratricopeptide (TPR) repeat protein